MQSYSSLPEENDNFGNSSNILRTNIGIVKYLLIHNTHSIAYSANMNAGKLTLCLRQAPWPGEVHGVREKGKQNTKKRDHN